MDYEVYKYQDTHFKWSATCDSEHPDFVLFSKQGEIWVQVENTYKRRQLVNSYLKEQSKLPISHGVAQNIISQIVDKGYLTSYFQTKCGLIYNKENQLVEN